MYTDTNGRFRTFGFQRNFSLLCFRQTRLVRAGPREELGDLVSRHNNGQTALFPHFLQLQTGCRYDSQLRFATVMIFRVFRNMHVRMRCVGSLPCDQKSSCSVMTRWRWPCARSPRTRQDAETRGGSGACPSGSSMRTCHSGQRSQGAGEQSPGETPGSALTNAQWATSWMEQVSGLTAGSFASPAFCLSGYKSPDFQDEEAWYIYLEGN